MKTPKVMITLAAVLGGTLCGASAGSTTEQWTIKSQAEWDASLSNKSNVEVKDGFVTATAEDASFTSVMKRFRNKTSVTSVTFEQSPVWENWVPTENIGTKSMVDAPVLLSLGPDNYWMFARYSNGKAAKKQKGQRAKAAQKKMRAFKPKATTLEGFDIPLQTTRYSNEFTAPGGQRKSLGGYHAWQSRDMKNWVHHGPITERASRWMTTAEFVDGKAYFYYDFPNDQDPHLYIDDNLTDGQPGKNMGLAFKDPSDGSDCGFIRDLDGNFHVIAEDWGPINARTHAWDSPLATHAVSPDGLNDFKILAPPVDHRTKATGATGTYQHPHWNKEDPVNFKTGTATYEIHAPEQNAYGDWAAISIGGRYYLFSDFDPAGKHGSASMSVGRFTAESINGPFEWCGNIGKGHPDPDVCFAEGQFYLATQARADFTSPGPWVETVEVRVGVDTTKNAEVDQWSEWQVVKESYDYTPGFAKQVQKTAAAMDLAALPEGYGFQVEVRMTDTTENASKPILDAIEIAFKSKVRPPRVYFRGR